MNHDTTNSSPDSTAYHRYSLSDIDFSHVDRYTYFPWMESKTPDQSVVATQINLNDACFHVTANYTPYTVLLSYHIGITTLQCNCEERNFCVHQKAVLAELFRQEIWLSFFDRKRYMQLLRKTATQYGLLDDDELERYFSVKWEAGQLAFQLKEKKLLSLDDLDFEQTPKIAADQARDIAVRPFIVIYRHKYYRHLQVQLYEAGFTKSGKPRNPIRRYPIGDQLWRTTSKEESLFYAALWQLSQSIADEENQNMAELINALVKNPLDFPIFAHDPTLGEKITAASIRCISLKQLRASPSLTVDKKGTFYTMSGHIQIDNSRIPLRDLDINFKQFIVRSDRYYFVENDKHLRLINLFRERKENQLMVHESQFDAFNKLFLTPLSDSAEIKFACIPKATKTHLNKFSFYSDIQHIIYLDNSQDFIHITPVMRYGDIEVPIRSKRNMFGTDENGQPFSIERKTEKELQMIALLIKQHPFFEEQLGENTFNYFYLHRKHFLNPEWFLESFEAWRKQDILIVGFNSLKENKLSPFKGTIHIEVLSGENWFNTHISVKFGKAKASLKQLEKAVRNKSNYVMLDDGTLGILPEHWLQKFTDYFQFGEIMDDANLKIPKYHYPSVKEYFAPDHLSEEVKNEIAYLEKRLNDKNIDIANLPTSFKGTLRNYQLEGVNWLYKLDRLNLGACLADEMGLGKTVQILAFISILKSQGAEKPSLIVAPTTLLFNWKLEIQQFLPQCRILMLDGPNRKQSTATFQEYDVILTSYHNILNDINFLKKYYFDCIILDESQYIKNPDTQRHITVQQLKSRNRIILSGTPIENNTMDLFAQISFIAPGLLGNKKYFKDVFTTPIDAFHNRPRVEMLKERIRPFILRRTKAAVLNELPEKDERIVYCEMGIEQRRIYDLYEKEFRDFIAAKDGEEIQKNSMHVLKGLTRLRQICNSTKLLKDEDPMLKDSSAKIATLVEHVQNNERDHKIVVFSQFVSMLHLIEDALRTVGVGCIVLSGKSKNRELIVNRFQTDDAIRVFLVSLKVGGTGLNLVVSDLIYLIDPWWNPAVEQQAIDRIHRIGQTKKVTAIRLLTPDTVEEKIQKMQRHKMQVGQAIITGENSQKPFYIDRSYLLKILSNDRA